jgi:hypothetical protein
MTLGQAGVDWIGAVVANGVELPDGRSHTGRYQRHGVCSAMCWPDDVVGQYSRPDVRRLLVNRRVRRPDKRVQNSCAADYYLANLRHSDEIYWLRGLLGFTTGGGRVVDRPL